MAGQVAEQAAEAEAEAVAAAAEAVAAAAVAGAGGGDRGLCQAMRIVHTKVDQRSNVLKDEKPSRASSSSRGRVGGGRPGAKAGRQGGSFGGTLHKRAADGVHMA